MSALALHTHPDAGEARRYGAAAIAIVLLHVAVIAAASLWYERPEPEGISIPAILVDLAPAPSAPKIETADLAPDPQVQEAEAPPPEPPKLETIEQLPPTPPQPTPIVAAPPKVEPKPEPSPAKPQPVRDKRPVKKKLVEQSTAAKAERVAPEQPSPSSGASAAAAASSYRARLIAHLQNFKRTPGATLDRDMTALVSFTVTRNGRVVSSRLVRSTGMALLDQEASALLQRAQPLPAFPPEMREASIYFELPYKFTAR
jgi:periplasmic protein TonB